MVLAIGTIVFSRDKHRRTKSRHFGGFFVAPTWCTHHTIDKLR